jgi:ring-1,2-phenylacetyl-CoA epoxidase subunit PaaC
MDNNLFAYILRIADDSLICGHRLSEWCGHGPILEEDIALTNMALDLIGQATTLLEYAGKVEGEGRDEDQLAFLRYERDYCNSLLVEQPNGDYGMTIIRQFLFDAFRLPLFEMLQHSKDEQLAAIAQKSLKETKYHYRHSAEWVIRLGDGTDESHKRIQSSLDLMWRYSSDLFSSDEVQSAMEEAGIAPKMTDLKAKWQESVHAVLNEATLTIPKNNWEQVGGRIGKHSEHLGYLLAEMQYMQRAYPNMEW